MIKSTDPDTAYTISNISLEFDTTINASLASQIQTEYMKNSILYERILRAHIIQLNKSDTSFSMDINSPSKSLKGALLIFTQERSATKFAEDTEEFYNPKITKVEVTVEGVPNELHAQNMEYRHQYNQIIKHFSEGHLKGAGWVQKDLQYHNIKHYSEDLFVKKLKEIDFPNYLNFKDIDEAYSDFTGKVASVIDEIAPIKEVRVKSNSQDWFDAEINEEIERWDKLLAKFKKSRSHSDNENYKKSRNKIQHMIKDKKKNFVIGKLNNNIGKPKELWKSLKSLGLPSKESSSATICLEKDGILSFDPKTNAEIFKDFYSNLANNLVKKLPTPPNKYGKTAVNNYYKKLNLRGKNFSFAPVAPATILKLLKQLNPAKSAGIDSLTGKFLKEGAPVLASPITDLVNLSISLSLFPDDCKIAKLKPLYKKEAKTKPKNYRPISLLPLLSKITERIIHNQTQEFLDKNNILYKYQSGFRKHHSTDTCLSYLTDKVKIGFEEGLLTGMVLIDLQKAFDTIDHSILLEKMSCLGFAGKTIAWYKSYLTNRSFIVNVGKEFSSPVSYPVGFLKARY